MNDQENLYTANELAIVGLQEIKQIFRMTQSAVSQWRARSVLPEPDATISGFPVWKVQTIITWGLRTGRPVYLSEHTRQRFLTLARKGQQPWHRS